jgi:epoxyqueuosine reductase
VRPFTDTEWLVATAKSLGFDLCGVTRAEDLAPPEHRQEWLDRGYAGTMRYLHDPRRADPARALPEAQSVVVCAVNYNTAHPYSTEAAAANAASTAVASGPGAAAVSGPKGWLSRYAWGEDYHIVINEKLDALVAAMNEKFGAENFSSRAWVDTGPVSERAAAHQAGLGWLAKNTCIINKEIGSWLFLGVILTSLDLAPFSPGGEVGAVPTPPPDLCGNCTLCLDACPTGALIEPYVLDARRCISYLTIELRDAIPEEFRAAMGWQVFGCDICQDVCPWNRHAPASDNPAFAPRPLLVAPELEWLLNLSEDEFRRLFQNSAVRRTKYRGLIRNACVVAGNSARAKGTAKSAASSAALRARLQQLAASHDALIAEHARWAFAQFAASAKTP